MANLFLNRWLFSDEKVSLGIYEDIFETNKVVIAFYSTEKDLLVKFREAYTRKYKSRLTFKWYDEWNEGYLKRHFSRVEFFDHVEARFTEELNRFRNVSKVILDEGGTSDGMK